MLKLFGLVSYALLQFEESISCESLHYRRRRSVITHDRAIVQRERIGIISGFLYNVIDLFSLHSIFEHHLDPLFRVIITIRANI